MYEAVAEDEDRDKLAFVSFRWTMEMLISICPTRDPANLLKGDLVTYSQSDWDCRVAAEQVTGRECVSCTCW